MDTLFLWKQKPYSAITVQIDRLTSEEYDIDDSSGIVDLIEVVRLQTTGPSEASRALRKKLKYGSVHRQLRALTILDFIIQNTTTRYLRGFTDEPLLERLRVAATDPVSDQEVKDKCRQLFLQWSSSFNGVAGMERIAALHRQLPRRKKPMNLQQSKVLKETEAHPEPPIGHSVSISTGNGPSTVLSSTSSKASRSGRSSISKIAKDKSHREKAFNLEKERPEILQTIASASMAGTNLLNSLKRVNRENERVSDNAEVMSQFDLCKDLRRQILRYIQNVESEDFLGSLIHANDELVNALMTFEVLDKSVDDDSDSDSEGGIGEADAPGSREMNDGFADLNLGGITKPPRPAKPSNFPYSPRSSVSYGKQRDADSQSEESEEEDDDEDNPFGDRNAVNTPGIERSGLTW
ncbi:hypothetical protein ACJ73_01099 [Blastomyces percursus]|uniref:VHS domain-containing protein n=1 Tax=Blastomyces percursus TaxID=1658174 RepID=A0A1J9QG88_9EURO|nr:hypothetical protein ACJ73_01099 [Blastomyces percursus]